jgi:hypothetical protein
MITTNRVPDRGIFDASESLTVIVQRVGDFEDTGLVLSGDEVRELVRQVKAIRTVVKQLEFEVSEYRWNKRARADREEKVACLASIVAELQNKHSNVRLFPIVPRPRPHIEGPAA